MAEKNTELLKRGTSKSTGVKESLEIQCFSMSAWQTACTSIAQENCWNEDSRTTGVWDSNSIEHFSDWPGILLWGCQKWASERGYFKSTRHGCKRGRAYRMRKRKHGCKCHLLVALDLYLLLLHGLLSLTNLGFNFGNLIFLLFCYFLLPGLACAHPITTWASLLNKAWGQVDTETTGPHHPRSLFKVTTLYHSYLVDAW